jgi:hypothetical protein
MWRHLCYDIETHCRSNNILKLFYNEFVSKLFRWHFLPYISIYMYVIYSSYKC